MNSAIKPNLKKILIVSYSFFPDNNPRSLRWQALANQFIEKGYEVHILTQQKSRKKGLKIYGQKKPILQEKQKIEKKRFNLSFLAQVLKKRIGKLFKIFIWPDYSASWLPWAFCKLFVLNLQNNYERIISSSHPMSGHLPVLLLRKIGLLKSPFWIVDIGDPFGLISFHNLNNQFLYKKLNFFFEKSVCKTANLICVTTKQTRNLYLEGYKLIPEKVIIAPPVLSLDLNTNKSLQNPFSKYVNFIFAGTLYKDIRNPQIVLAFADYLEKNSPAKYNFHFFGVLGDCAEYFKSIRKNVFTYGLVDQADIKPYLFHSNGVINIGNTSKYQLPSKIIEAIASKKFIFNFCINREDTSSDFLESYPGHFNIYDEQDFSDAFLTFENSQAAKEKIEAASEIIIANHSPQIISQLFLRN